MSEHSYDISPQVRQFEHAGAKHELREADEGATIKYREAITACGTFNVEGDWVRTKPTHHVGALLVGLCLRNDKGEPIGEEAVRSLPRRLVKRLYEDVLEISDLREESDSIEAIDAEIANLQRRKEALLKKDERAKNS